jgi:DNA polymerase III subunit epsilon
VKIKLTKPLAFFDLETTGINITQDRIVEIAILKIMPDGSQIEFESRINPTIPIPPQSTQIHGISDDDVKDKPTFKEKAHEIVQFLKDCDFAGYNSNKFDVPLLAEEFARVETSFDWTKRKFIDVQVVFYKKEPRTLSAAYSYYCNKDLTNAHSAMADTKATYEILEAQLERYEDIEPSTSFLNEYTSQTKNVDFAGRIIYNDKGDEIFNFGKHKGKSVEKIFETEPGYYNWMMNGDFASNTKQVLTAIKLRAFNK